MNEGFFEGKDFEGGEFKALIPKYYPQKYKKYIEEETELLKIKLKDANRILEAGIGIGRLIPEIAPIVKEFVGIDNADLMLKKSQEVSSKFSNVKNSGLMSEMLLIVCISEHIQKSPISRGFLMSHRA